MVSPLAHIMMCVRCDHWQDQVTSLKKILRQKEEEVQLLTAALEEKNRAEKQLKEAADRREREYRAHSADCEAQLVRLRSQVTRLSRSFEHLKEKRHQERLDSNSVKHLRNELDRTNLHHSNEGLKRALARLSEEEVQGEKKQLKPREWDQEKLERMLEETTHMVETGLLDPSDSAAYIPLQPTPMPAQEPSELLTQVLDKHFAQLNEELLKLLKHN